MKLIATDLDGTLLRDDKTVSPRTRDALELATEAGAEVVFVTARPPRFVDALGVTGTAVCSNGAIVYDIGTRTVVSTQDLSPAAVRKVALALAAAVPDIGFAVETGHHLKYEPGYALRMPEDADGEYPLAAWDDLWSLPEPVVKLLAYSSSHDADFMVAAAEAAAAGEAQFTHSGGHGLLEVSARGVVKAGALAALCSERGIAAADVITFGDMPNDLTILSWAGVGYAMGNAHEAVLAAADRRTLSNEEDGVAVVLEELFG